MIDTHTRQRPFGSPGLMLRLAPFGAAAVVGFTAPLAIPGTDLDSNPRSVILAALVALVTVAIVALLRAERLPRWCEILPIIGFMGVLALMRSGTVGRSLPYLPLGTVAVFWLALYHERVQAAIGAGLITLGMVGVLTRYHAPMGDWIDGLERLGLAVGTGMVVVHLLSKLRVQQSELAHMAITDPTTGAANQRTWELTTRSQMNWSRRNQETFTIGRIRIGDLEPINQRHGFTAGDSLLAAAAAAWVAEMRETDTLFRLYGSEFVVVLPNAGSTVASMLLERMRAVSPTLTCSFGGATWNGSESIAELMARAAVAREDAAERGGDRVVMASGSNWIPEATRTSRDVLSGAG